MYFEIKHGKLDSYRNNSKMEIFAILRNQLAMCGIAIAQKLPKSNPFNMRNSTVSFMLYLYVSLNALSLNGTSTFDEWIYILFRSVSIATCGFVYVIIVWKTSNLFEFINNLNGTVNERE